MSPCDSEFYGEARQCEVALIVAKHDRAVEDVVIQVTDHAVWR